ncbi:MAG: DUF4388 domain-containing protein [Candidatus Eisenbacteria bacterium]
MHRRNPQIAGGLMDSPVVLAGELGLIGLFDLGQLLQLNRATGVLSVTHDGKTGYLYFEAGQIVNATDDERDAGEYAAYRLFGWKHGAYEFRHGLSRGPRAIHQSTEGLMLEAARRMDESGPAQGHLSATERLQVHGDKFEALHEVFHDVAHEEPNVAATEVGRGDSPPLERLREDGDALVYRPGYAPRFSSRGQWRTLDGPPLDSAAYEQVKARLLDGVWPPLGPGDRGPQTRSTTLEGGRRATLTVLPAPNETLCVRPAQLEPVGSERLRGPLDLLLGLLAMPHGLVLVSGPDAASADRLLHAVVALLVQHRPATVLLVGDTDRWKHREARGLLLRTPAFEACTLLEAVSPEIAAFDTASGAYSLAALHIAPLVFAAVVAHDDGTTLARWLARHDKRAEEASAVLAGTPLGVVHTPRARTSETLPFLAARVNADERPLRKSA